MSTTVQYRIFRVPSSCLETKALVKIDRFTDRAEELWGKTI